MLRAGIPATEKEVGSPGNYGWGGFFYTEFVIDPKEELIAIFLARLHPDGGLNINQVFKALAHQSIID